jgi:hypothetical protein
MNMPWNFEEMAANMEPHQFELLLRAYVKLHAVRAQDRAGVASGKTAKGVQGGFAFSIDSKGTLESATWNVCFGYGLDTKGEILEPAFTELCRRAGWAESPQATLRQIAAPVSKN